MLPVERAFRTRILSVLEESSVLAKPVILEARSFQTIAGQSNKPKETKSILPSAVWKVEDHKIFLWGFRNDNLAPSACTLEKLCRANRAQCRGLHEGLVEAAFGTFCMGHDARRQAAISQ